MSTQTTQGEWFQTRYLHKSKLKTLDIWFIVQRALIYFWVNILANVLNRKYYENAFPQD